MIKIYIPKNIKFLILNNKYLYIYNFNYFFLINLSKNNFFFNNLLNILHIELKNKVSVRNKNFINNFIFLWDNYFFSKLYFLGKGFKLKKIDNNTYFNFNYSHIKLIINQTSILKKIQKNKILIFTKNFQNLKKLENYINKIKPLNFYTKRGIRKSKQIVFIKKNKTSN
uniref:Ribosomal protein L6 n=1 Tax=Uronema marinum TaxID=35107 RepID=A0A345WJV2_UROMR|nr:ribosomal protein L6 [Uronema marinum]AXJ93345.1 ribosomal protein L6 [Uronema marinum]